jgi:hypothetical protein
VTPFGRLQIERPGVRILQGALDDSILCLFVSQTSKFHLGVFSKVCRQGPLRLCIPAQTDKRFQHNLTESKSPDGTGDVERRKGEDRETNLYGRRLIHGFIQ